MELLKNIIYINLDKRTDRKEHVENELKKIGITNSKRFSAIELEHGALGCTYSHIACLNYAIEHDLDMICICEDDITFLDSSKFIDSLTKFNETVKDWDVLFLGGNNFKPFEEINDVCIKIHNCNCSTGYIVKKHYYRKLLNNLIEGSYFFKYSRAHWLYALDVYWKTLQKVDNWYLLIPINVTQYANFSDIEKRDTDYTNDILKIDK